MKKNEREMSKILVVDDTRSVRSVLKDILEVNGYNVELAESGEEASGMIGNGNYNLIISDIMLPGMSGVELLRKTLEDNPEIPFIMVSGHANIKISVDLIKDGAFYVLEKPIDMNSLIAQVKLALKAVEEGGFSEVAATPRKKSAQRLSIDNIESLLIGNCKKMMMVKDMIKRAAASKARVLILGENGTGKELVAREIHRLGCRSGKAFVEINCAAIPSELIESELFGHEKGSFTGAYKQKKGKFELAHNGTLFLDEVGDMSLSAQAKVLRALQENRITHVGGDRDIEVDVRVVAATNKDIEKEIEEGRFRRDLYHRLNVVIIRMPTLNEREDDIPMLAENFLAEKCKQYCVPLKKFSSEAIEMLKKHTWSGNVRELGNIIERLIVFSGDEITKNDINTYVDEQYESLYN